jgi:hypothetical protein
MIIRSFLKKDLKDDLECAERVESIEVREGFPAEVILSKADELNRAIAIEICDLICREASDTNTLLRYA